MPSPKTLEVRLTEVRVIYEKLHALGLPHDDENIASFRTIANHFVKTGEGASGQLPLRGFKRILVYKLSNQSHIQSTVVLKYAEHV